MAYQIQEIGKNFYLLRSDEEDFHRNIYVKIFKKENKAINLIMDPGSRVDIDPLTKSLEELIGGVDKIDLIFLSHQDPDVSSATPFLLSIAPGAVVITSQDTMRLIKMYGIPAKRLKAVEDFRSETVHIKHTGHRIKFVPAYFCHFRGAMMLYDFESRVLFTGDFMGGLNTVKGRPIYATEEAWEGISLFHSIYMPSNLAIKHTIDRISLLNPFPEVIAPQHGYVVKSDLIVEFLTRLSTLNVGMDLLTHKEPTEEQFLLALNEFVGRIRKEYSNLYSAMYEKLFTPGNFSSPFIAKGGEIVKLKIIPSDALKFILDVLKDETDSALFKKLLTILLGYLEKYNISHLLPPAELEVQHEKIDIKEIFEE